MQNKNIYEDRLESISFQEMLDGLAGIGKETGRLEVKREPIANSKIAYIACSMANADGGIIAIGLQDPDANGAMRIHGVIDVSDRTKVGMLASINARVHPPLPLDIQGFESDDRAQSFLIVRVGRSETAPHEYTGSDEAHNLPVRRGSATGHLRLSEIDALRVRSSAAVSESPMGQQQFSRIYLQHEGTNPDFIFGLAVHPVFYPRTRRVMDLDDDHLCFSIAEVSKGANSALHHELAFETLIDGAWLHTALKTQQDAVGGRVPAPDQQIEIRSDGAIAVRFLQNDTNLLGQFFGVLAVGYVAAQEVFWSFGLAPQAYFYHVQRLSAVARDSRIAQAYEDRFVVDLATEKFADAFLPTTMRMLRAANQNSRREVVRIDMLQAFVSSYIPYADELQKRWLS